MILKKTIKVAVFSPIRGKFDYLPCDGDEAEVYQKGQRVIVPFRNSERLGVVLSVYENSKKPKFLLKKIAYVLDEQPLLSNNILRLAEWASNYYHHPLGPVIAILFPPYLRKKNLLKKYQIFEWQISDIGKCVFKSKRTGKWQKQILCRLLESGPLTTKEINAVFDGAQLNQVLLRLYSRGWIEKKIKENKTSKPFINNTHMVRLNTEQSKALSFIKNQSQNKTPIVLNGVTGSGKTEVYIELIKLNIESAKQVILLVPEITLAEHLFKRLEKVFPSLVGIAHSGYTNVQRLETWEACRSGRLKILIGTRSAIWTPMHNLGLIIVDEEHDPSYRQQDGFMYSGRDTAIVRAKFENIQILLGSATPSLETFRNIELKRFKQVFLTKGAIAPKPPLWEVVDLKKSKSKDGLSEELLFRISEAIRLREQVLLFLNRRGYSPALICSSCGYKPICRNCDWAMVYHKTVDSIVCHHCGYSIKKNELNCCNKKKMRPLGLGTERIHEAIKKNFPKAAVERVDSDVGLSSSEVQELFRKVSDRNIDILIGTQMVAKGLDFSGITLIGILNPDSALYSGEFKAEERLAQLLVQVSGRAARSIKRGRVILQSEHAEHPIILRLKNHGYAGYVETALTERRCHNVPPFSIFALIKATSKNEARIKIFLNCIREVLILKQKCEGLNISQVIPMTLYKKAGFYRSTIIVRSGSRIQIQKLIASNINKIEELSRQNKVRWSIELDPEGML